MAAPAVVRDGGLARACRDAVHGEFEVKTTFRTMVLSALLVPFSTALAHAQTVAPAPAPGTPGAPVVGTPPAPDGTTTSDKDKDKNKGQPAAATAPASGAGSSQLGAGGNPFRLSWFTWNANASTKSFGVGKDYIGTEDEVASMDFSFTPRYSFVNNKTDWAWVGLNINWAVELTNSDSSTKIRQPLFGDLGVQSAYNHTFVRTEKGTTAFAGPRLSLSFPTSMASQAASIYMRTALGVGGAGNIVFHDGDWFNSVFVSVGTTWQHTFSGSNVPYNEGLLNRPRQGLTPTGVGLLEQNSILSGSYLIHDQINLTGTYYLSLIGDLSLGNSFGIQVPFRYTPVEGQCVQISTGCAPIESGVQNQEPQQNIPSTIFDLSLNYTIGGFVWATLGYNNSSRQIGEGGTRRSIFYSPDAQFYASATIMLDAIYGKLTAKPKKKTASFGQLLGY